MEYIDTMKPYDAIKRDDIQYTYCHDFNHISRYRGLRQIIHQGMSSSRYVALETPNDFSPTDNIEYYIVPASKENRLDLIAKEKLGSAAYSWVIAYFNHIEDGFTCTEGTKLAIPKSVSSLMESGQILPAIPATKLNLGSE